MYFESKKISLIILAITALVCSRILFSFFNDPEGPNLLVVMAVAVLVYFLSVAAYVYYPSTLSLTGLKRFLLAIFIQVIIVGGFYFWLN